MRITIRLPAFAMALAASVACGWNIQGATPSLAEADTAWEKLLRIQLDENHKCSLSGVIFVREMPSGNAILYSGRAKCFDGREFDFSQSKPHMKFDIKACEPAVC